jgi:hypothetical protein
MQGPLAALQTHPWAFPALEFVHIAGIGLLFGGLVLFELRLFGLGRAIALAPFVRLVLPMAVAGFCIAAASGLLMFATQPWELLVNPAFRLKMLILVVAGSNAVWFHARGTLQRAEAHDRTDALGRLSGLVSIGSWLAIIACGRAIAYV